MSDERAAEQASRVRGLLRRVARLPLPVLAVVCILPAFVGWLSWPTAMVSPFRCENCDSIHWMEPMFCVWISVGLFLPGVIRRRRWSGLWISFVVGISVCLAIWGMSKVGFIWQGRYGDIVLMATGLAVLSVSEMIVRRDRSIRTILWMTALTTTIPLCIGGAMEWARLSGWTLGSIRASHVGLGVLAVVWWTMLPAVFRESRSPSRRSAQVALVGVMLGLSVVSILSMQYWCWPVAQRSVVSGGPFTRKSSVWLLAWRKEADDLAALRYAVENITQGEEGAATYFVMNYWRKRAIDALAQDDPARTAELLLRMLKQNPSRSLMCQSAEALAAQKRYDVVPLFLGEALFYGSMVYENGPIDALVSMGIPQVAIAIVFSEIKAVEPGYPTTILADSKARKQLITILGSDAGDNLMDWAHLYDERIGQLPTPLTEELQAEVDLILNAYLQYLNLGSQWDADCVAHVVGPGGMTPEARTRGLELRNSVGGTYWHGQSGKQLQDEVEQYRLRIEKARRLLPTPPKSLKKR
jgi:hypothetical protein